MWKTGSNFRTALVGFVVDKVALVEVFLRILSVNIPPILHTLISLPRTPHCLQTNKGKAVLLQDWSGPEGSRKLRFPDYMTTAQDGGKIVSLTHRPPLPLRNAPDTHFCYRLSRLQGHSAIGRIMSIEKSNDTIWNRTSNLPICSTVS
jgi:hypothetical protein